MYYIHKDYLGSFQSITDEDGTLVELIPTEERSREGRRRNPDDWSFTDVQEDYLFDRGYTGHSLSRKERNGKHLDHFGLINMNGRVYDPFVAHFLSPDPFVSNPTGMQGFNRYSYVSNNPLKFIDPSGYFEKPTGWDSPLISSTAFGPGVIGTNVFSGGGNSTMSSINGSGFSSTGGSHAGQGVHYDWNTQHYYDNDGNIISYQQAHNHYQNNYTTIEFVFTGTTSNPYETLIEVNTIDVGVEYKEDDQAGGGDMVNQFSGSEKAALGLVATSGSINLTTGIIDKLSGTVKNADVVNFGKSVTKKFGLVGVGMTTYNSFSDGTFTVGDGARILMSGVTFIPYAGWIYGAIDMGVLLTTGISATDRIGNYVDLHWAPGPIRP